MKNNNVEVSVLVGEKSIREYPYQGRSYLESKDGSSYSIKIKNNNSFRIMAVISVDGLDVLTGNKITDDSVGYVLNPNSSETIHGFRLSDEQVAQFKFAKKEKSYSKLKNGETINCGVIGVAVYSEKQDKLKEYEDKLEELKKKIKENGRYSQPHIIKEYIPYSPPHPWYHRPYWDYSPIWLYQPQFTCGVISSTSDTKLSYSYPQNQCSMGGAVSANCTNESISNVGVAQNSINSLGFDMGTQFGQAKDSLITHTSFEKDVLLAVFELFYASKESLVQMGVDLSTKPKVALPTAFPNSNKIKMAYCTPPDGWDG